MTTQRIPFYRPSLTDAEINEVVHTLRSGWLTTGPKTKQFEKEFSTAFGHKHSVAVNSCTAALHLALEAIGVKPGDSVLVPTMTFAATAEVVRYLGAKPILADCRESDFNLDVADAQHRIEAARRAGERVTAIMPVHYGGQIGDVDGVATLAHRYDLKIVEDAAHCCPAYYRLGKAESRKRKAEIPTLATGASSSRREEAHFNTSKRPLPNLDDRVAPERNEPPHVGCYPSGAETPSCQLQTPNSHSWLPVGSSADISCYSFYANKCITTGEGGMACTNSDEYADRMRIMSLHGISRDAWKRFTAEGSWYYEIIAPGFKYNLTDIASAIGIHQLRRADELHRRRTCLAEFYTDRLRHFDELILPRQLPDRIHSWHLYAIRLKLDRLSIDRGQFIQELQNRGVGISVHWMPLHMHPYYRETYRYTPEQLPVAARLYKEIITLPLYPDMTEGDIQYVCNSIRGILSQNRATRLVAADVRRLTLNAPPAIS